MYIVSPNYRNRESSLKWLIREADKSPDASQAVSSVYAYGVKFEYSHSSEPGFSCDMVAVCDNAIVDALLPYDLKPVRIHFHKDADPTLHMGFYVEGSRERIHTCQYLILIADGTMYAVL